MRGAWVEMTLDKRRKKWYLSLPVRGAWVEMAVVYWYDLSDSTSLPVRGAWVEMRSCTMALALMSVAPRAGSVG